MFTSTLNIIMIQECTAQLKISYLLPSGANIILKTLTDLITDFFHQSPKYILKKKTNSKVPNAKLTFVSGI